MEAEDQYLHKIRQKDQRLRTYLRDVDQPTGNDPQDWFAYLLSLKGLQGNTNNDLSFLATLLAKAFLSGRFDLVDFDAAEKPQGAPGIDIETETISGEKIAAEIKTTTPYQPGFGAAQKTSIIKDLKKLAASCALHRYMFVTDQGAFDALKGRSFSAIAPGVEVVNLLTNESFKYE